jgi:hypothetical protein
MPGRSTQHQPSSLLLGLPQDLRIEIAPRVGATSERPLADLRSLRSTCSTMHRVCGHGDVGRCLSIERIRDEISWVWNPTAYKAFLAMLSGLGNLEAGFLSGIKAFFIEHRGWARCGILSICHLALQRQWWCRQRRHREGIHEAGRGRRQYDVVEMAEQRGVSAFAREGHACTPLLDLAHLG